MRNPLLSILLKTKLDRGVLLPLLLQHRDLGFVLCLQSMPCSLWNLLLQCSLCLLLCAPLFDLCCFEVGGFPLNLWLGASAVSWFLWKWTLYFFFLFFLPLDSFGEEKGEVLILCHHLQTGRLLVKCLLIFKVKNMEILIIVFDLLMWNNSRL